MNFRKPQFRQRSQMKSMDQSAKYYSKFDRKLNRNNEQLGKYNEKRFEQNPYLEEQMTNLKFIVAKPTFDFDKQLPRDQHQNSGLIQRNTSSRKLKKF